MNKTLWIVLGVLALGYWYTKRTGLQGNSTETTIPDSDQPNMKTKVPAGVNTDHMWLVKG